MQKTIDKNQLNLLEDTTHGYMPRVEIDFCGSNYNEKKDKHRLNTKFLKVFEVVKNLGKFTNEELYKITRTLAINDDTASRFVRKISEIEFMGYFVTKDENKHPVVFECIKLAFDKKKHDVL